MKTRLLLFFALLIFLPFFAQNAAAQKSIYKDIYQQTTSGKITFGNSQLRLEINRQNGRWLSLLDNGSRNSIFLDGETSLDVKVDGQWLMAQTQAKVIGQKTRIDEKRKSVSLEITLAIENLEITDVYTLFSNESRIERSARVTRKSGVSSVQNSLPAGQAGISTNIKIPAAKFEGFLFRLPNAAVGKPSDCVFDAPGPFFPKSYAPPDMPLDSLKNREIHFHSAPDAGFGLLAVSNAKMQRTVASWMSTSGEVNYGSSVKGDGKRVSLSHHDLRYAYLPANSTVQSDIQHVAFTKNLPEALAQYRNMVAQTMPVDAKTPVWVREAVILEVYPDYFPDGFKGLTRKLPFYRDIGFNVIYLMPHWEGGYSPLDLYKVNAQYGTADDLKEMVRTAHELGMKVLFDMVIHGFNVKSPVLQQRPDIFIREENSEIALHPTWKSASTDWASPAYQQYMRDLVTHDIKTYGIDGYRVDAASYKGSNWDPNIPYPAYRSGTDAPELMRTMLTALRQVKPDAVLLNEVFGPVFYTVCNFSHDNQAEAPTIIQEKIEKGLYNAAFYKRHLADVYTLLPPGANRVFYTRNHDTSWFLHFNGYTPLFMNLEAIHAFFGIPEAFAGDRKHPFTPDEKPEVYQQYKQIFNQRKALPELIHGDILLNEVVSDNPNVFSGIRRMGNHATLVLISLSGTEETVNVTLPANLKVTKWQAENSISEKVETRPVTGGKITVKLSPHGRLVGRLQ